MGANSKDMTALFRDLRDAGFKLEERGPKLAIVAPDGEFTVMSPQARDVRTIKNSRAWAYRHGLPKPENQQKGADMPRRRKSGRRAAAHAAASQPPAHAPTVSPRPAPPPTAAPSRPSRSEVRALGPKLPAGHPALPEGDVYPLGDGVWLEPRRLVTPELAAKFLEYNQDNRNPSARVSAGYGRNMKDGGWNDKLGDPVRFADTGKMLDGQQRMIGVRDSGKAEYFVVITGLPESSQDAMDSGRRRSPSDQLEINGYKNSKVVAAAARLLWYWERDAVLSRTPSPTNVELVDYVVALSEPPVTLEQACSVAAGNAMRIYIPSSVLAACFYRMATVDAPAAAEFFNGLSSGANLPLKSPILALRDLATIRKKQGVKVSQAEWLYYMARAWALWRRGATAVRLNLPASGLTSQSIPNIT